MGPNPRYGRNLHAVNAHFRRAGAFRDSRMSQLERVAELEIEEALDDGWARGDLDIACQCDPCAD